MNNKISQETAIGCGLIIALGFPGIAWIWFGWKVALTVFIIGQATIYIAKSLANK